MYRGVLLLLVCCLSVYGKWDPKQMSQYKKPSEKDLREKLTPEQFKVTQREGTERAFTNEYWDHKEAGIYVDVVSGEPLFSSLDKYDSGTGWPSFSQPLEKDHIVTKSDKKLFRTRTEVRSRYGDSHLGHVFEDGPQPTGLRYCMNSASLRFVPVSKLEQEGYGKYLPLFSERATANKSPKEIAILAGGCFWGMEDILAKIPGVIETTVGYTGGTTKDPNYEQVKKGNTGHAESIRVVFDPSKLSYEDLLIQYFKMHDPTTLNQQGNDLGSQYRSAIFYEDAKQREVAEKVKNRVDKSGQWKKPVVTQLFPAGPFYPAEDYHQKYLKKNPGGYSCHFVRDYKF